MNDIIIDLEKYIHQRESALVGRPNGEMLLSRLKRENLIFKELEKRHGSIVIKIPQRIVTINKSYFLGFMETRIQELGKDAFIEKYLFDASEHIKEKIYNSYIDAALLEASQREILNID
jgi:hypothetical protein